MPIHWNAPNEEQAENRIVRFNWGVPLENQASSTVFAMLLGTPATAYYEARHLYRMFMKFNPDFWSN